MISRFVSIVLLASVVLMSACQVFTHSDATKPADAAATARNQGYASLYSTINDESGVDDVLKIKHPSPQVAELIKAIGQTTRDARKHLEAFAKDDPTLHLVNEGLTEMEKKTRDAISGATARKIFFSSGKDFEFRILLTQHEALNYIIHLADTVSKQESHEARKGFLSQLVKDSNALHERVLAQLEAPYVR